MDTETYTVEVHGPNGVKIVELPAGQVRIFTPEHGDDYRAALFLASADLKFHADKKALES